MKCPDGKGRTCDCRCEGCDPPPRKLHRCCYTHSSGCHQGED